MAIGDITKDVRIEAGNGYESLKKAINKKSGIWKIKRRDLVYLLNKQFEGMSETYGNLFIYMFYFSCTDPYGISNDPEWYKRVTENDTSTSESTAWCACYVSFVLNMAGITSKGHWGSGNVNKYVGLTVGSDPSTVKSFDTIDFASGHVAFAVREDTGKPNNYKDKFYSMGGNQGDSVKLGPSRWFDKKGVRGFGTSPGYDEEISAGDALSLLAYFQKANTKTPEKRMIDLKSRIEKKASTDQSDTALIKEVMDLRNKISSTNLITERKANKNPFYIFDNNIRERLKELLIFEQSLIDGKIPTTANVAQAQTKVNTRD